VIDDYIDGGGRQKEKPPHRSAGVFLDKKNNYECSYKKKTIHFPLLLNKRVGYGLSAWRK
jgi:hypothetical protein